MFIPALSVPDAIPSRAEIVPLIHSPAFVIDEVRLGLSLGSTFAVADQTQCRVLYSTKALSLGAVLLKLADKVHGFAASSLFEAKLCRSLMNNLGTVHVSSPGLRSDDVRELLNVCDYLSFNSLSQWQRFRGQAAGHTKIGVRVNPQLSFIGDLRYDPCRHGSKLGVPITQLSKAIADEPRLFEGISGIHFHNNCDSTDFLALFKTVQHVDRNLGRLLPQLEWVNIGGGYLPNEARSLDGFCEAVDLLRSKYDVDVFFEPGAAFVRNACSLVSTVVDLFESGGKHIAVLDTTVNHMPEVFEYQFEPDVAGHTDNGHYAYLLAGCTCLAGDLFGEYAFDQPLEIGSPVIFENVGAYSTVKWHMFNGVNLPTIYALTESGELVLKQQFTYEDFASRCGVETSAIV